MYSFTIDVLGTLLIDREILTDSYGMWFKSVSHINTIVSRGTPFRMLNSELLQGTFVDNLVLNYPHLQTTKFGSDSQTCQIFRDSWKNPDIQITSRTHNIDIYQDPKASFRTMMTATKKQSGQESGQ